MFVDATTHDRVIIGTFAMIFYSSAMILGGLWVWVDPFKRRK